MDWIKKAVRRKPNSEIRQELLALECGLAKATAAITLLNKRVETLERAQAASNVRETISSPKTSSARKTGFWRRLRGQIK